MVKIRLNHGWLSLASVIVGTFEELKITKGNRGVNEWK